MQAPQQAGRLHHSAPLRNSQLWAAHLCLVELEMQLVRAAYSVELSVHQAVVPLVSPQLQSTTLSQAVVLSIIHSELLLQNKQQSRALRRREVCSTIPIKRATLSHFLRRCLPITAPPASLDKMRRRLRLAPALPLDRIRGLKKQLRRSVHSALVRQRRSSLQVRVSHLVRINRQAQQDRLFLATTMHSNHLHQPATFSALGRVQHQRRLVCLRVAYLETSGKVPQHQPHLQAISSAMARLPRNSQAICWVRVQSSPPNRQAACLAMQVIAQTILSHQALHLGEM